VLKTPGGLNYAADDKSRNIVETKPHFYEWATATTGMLAVARKQRSTFRNYVAAETAAPVIACAAGKGPLDELDFQFAGVVRSNSVRTMCAADAPPLVLTKSSHVTNSPMLIGFALFNSCNTGTTASGLLRMSTSRAYSQDERAFPYSVLSYHHSHMTCRVVRVHSLTIGGPGVYQSIWSLAKIFPPSLAAFVKPTSVGFRVFRVRSHHPEQLEGRHPRRRHDRLDLLQRARGHDKQGPRRPRLRATDRRARRGLSRRMSHWSRDQLR
jgi:hypothetical protein